MKLFGPSKYDLIAASVIVIIILATPKLFDFENYPKRANGKELFTPILYETAKGVVTDKYLDKDHHNYPTIELTINDSLERYIDLTWDSGLYNYIRKSDSIITTNYGKNLMVRRPSRDTIIELNK